MSQTIAPVTYDLIVIGGGPAGYVAAIRAAQLGFKVACIEKRKELGGTCLNVGCIPSKALLDSSEHYWNARTKLSKHGVQVGDLKLDLLQMMKRKESIVRQLTQGIGGLFKKNKIEAIHGWGKLAASVNGIISVEVRSENDEKKMILASRVLLATGSEPSSLSTLAFDEKSVICSTEALSLSSVPKHLVVIGAGAVGLELGSVWLRLGAKVTVIEYFDRIVPGMDQQMGRELHKSLLKQGMEFRLSSKCLGAEKLDNDLRVRAQDRLTENEFMLDCDRVLVATGRRPYSNGLGLENLGIKKDEKGRVSVDVHYQTSVPGVYAVGDLIDGPMLAHKAEEEGIAAVERMKGMAGHVNYNAIPGVVYTDPELASVGATEEELKESGRAFSVGTFPFMANGRAKALDATEGLVKILSDEKTDRLLGVHIFGPRASELISEAVTVIEFGGSAEDIARTCHAHPTLSEAMKEAALAVAKRQIHL
jgi:dihydrolipoamide dehydrogenase